MKHCIFTLRTFCSLLQHMYVYLRTIRTQGALALFLFLFQQKKPQIVRVEITVGLYFCRHLYRPGLYLGVCRPCNCYGMASTCDPESGVCRGCREDSEGVNCERCREGFEGDPTRGVQCRCERREAYKCSKKTLKKEFFLIL